MCPPASPPFSFTSARPFAVGRIGGKVAVKPVCSDAQAMVAVRRNLVPAGADWLDPINLHQPTDATLANSEPDLFQLHGHPRTAIAAEAQPILFPDVGQHLHIRARALADRS